ncbi:hypothetical protein NMG60_11000436 [Bertholletia excelsa]
MTSVCISKCVDDARVPVRATYVNLYKWPESDAEFVRSAVGGLPHPRVVDSISCRQTYLRSYTFSRKETVPERTRKCLERVKERVARRGRHRRPRRGRRVVAALCAVFHRLLSCTASVDVVDQRDP